MDTVEKIAVYDDRLCEPSNVYLIKKASGSLAYNSVSAESESSTGASFTLDIPEDHFIGRNIKIKTNVKFTFAGLAGDGSDLVNLGATDAPRFSPLNNCLWDTVQVTFGNNSISLKNSEIFEPLCRMTMSHENKNFTHENSGTPMFQDCAQDYESVIGSGRNPLGGLSDTAGPFGIIPRGAFHSLKVVSVSSTAAVVTAEFIENVFIPGLSFSRSDAQALIGLKRLQIKLSYSSGDALKRMFSRNVVNSRALTSLDVKIGLDAGLAKSECVFETIGKPIYYKYDMSIPRRYPYATISNFQFDMGTLASGATTTKKTTALSVDIIPSKIWLLLRDTIRIYDKCDCYASISNVGLTFGGTTTSLSNASQFQLYEISARNGVNMQYGDWSKNIGSIVCLVPGVDFELPRPNEQSAGVASKMPLQFSITYTNTGLYSRDYSAIVIMEDSGILEIANGKVSVDTAIITNRDVSEIVARQDATAPDQRKDIFAGNFLEDLGDILKNGYKTGEAIYKVAKEGAPLIGLGKTGGALMTKNELMNRFK